MATDLPAPRRRARLRAQTTAEILEAARERLAAEGPAGVTLRAIARDLGTGVSSLYRYFDSRDDLITELLVEAFNSQADTVAAAVAAHPDAADALRASLHAYRDWSLAHPTQFALAYGTPVPGYQAPGDRTIGPGTRVGGQVIELLTALWRAGRLDQERLDHRDAELAADEREDLAALASRRGYGVPLALLSLVADLMVAVHGFVVMEVFGQLRPFSSRPAVAFERITAKALVEVGLVR